MTTSTLVPGNSFEVLQSHTAITHYVRYCKRDRPALRTEHDTQLAGPVALRAYVACRETLESTSKLFHTILVLHRRQCRGRNEENALPILTTL